MGCGRSKLQSIYPRHRNNSKNKQNNNGEKCSENGSAVSGGHDQNASGSAGEESPESRRKAAMARGRQFITSPALFAMTEASSSQEDFFKMLDEKIENGPDYDSAVEQQNSRSSVVTRPPPPPPRPSSAHGQQRYPTVLASPSRRQVSSRPPQRLLPTLQASPPPHEPKS